mmetsp:Transcript_58621/g.138055  ORF Transcript_58621/g.138055 Transcript_58621/m.138055 type:complete len:232 (+) Transcript_58621:2093-2788(+)
MVVRHRVGSLVLQLRSLLFHRRSLFLVEESKVSLRRHRRRQRRPFTKFLLHVRQRRLDCSQLCSGLGPRNRTLQNVRHSLLAMDSVELLLLEPHEDPVGQQWLQPFVVPREVQERHMRQPLQRLGRISFLDRTRNLTQRIQRDSPSFEGRDLAVLGVEERIIDVDGQPPALPIRRAIEIPLLTEWKIELTLQGMQNQINLVQQHHPTPEELDHAGELLDLLLHVLEALRRL